MKVVENVADCVHITMPAPPRGHLERADDELSDAAGDTFSATCHVDQSTRTDDADRLGACLNDAVSKASE